MRTYKPRRIEFKEVFEINDWKIKIYMITKLVEFNHPEFYKNVKAEIPKWLKMENSFNSENDKIGFLIIHSGTEGIFSVINWWVGINMLNTHIFLTRIEQLDKFEKISGDGLAPCIWELEVINHERISWISNILKQEPMIDYQDYLEDVFNREI
ncbi:MAG: hypothetical protein KKA81_02395 [Bacteroidetes bacterium]|nr:hypothetical protein [Bacteroidota bacterium]